MKRSAWGFMFHKQKKISVEITKIRGMEAK